MSLLKLDHLAVTSETLEAGVAYVASAFGVPLAPGGEHVAMGTHNKLLSLGPDLYLETIAIDPEADSPDRPRWFNLDNTKGPARLANWICQTDDLDAALKTFGAEFGETLTFERGDLRWRMAVPKDGVLPFDGCAPALIQWDTDRHPARDLPDQDVRLILLRVRHPKADALRDLLEPHLPKEIVEFQASPLPALDAQFATPMGPARLQ